jgi:hypothetical protein
LRSGTDTGHRKTDVDCGADTAEEELGLQEDLAVRDGDNLCQTCQYMFRPILALKAYVGRDVSRYITTLSLNNGKRSERASTELVVHLCCTLEETRVQVENVTGVSLTTWRATEKEGHLTVGHGLLGQIIVDNEGCTS